MNVLFDLDGTLTDSREGILACIRHALVTLGAPVPEDPSLDRFLGPPLWDTFRELLPEGSGEVRVDAAVAAYRERFTRVGMFENRVYDHIPDVLASLAAGGARLFVATSKPRVFAERILAHFGLADRFDRIYGSELDGRLTDKGELIAHVLSTSSLDAAETAMVGDRRHDIAGALENRVTAIGALWGYGSRDELAAAGAHRLMERPDELAGIGT